MDPQSALALWQDKYWDLLDENAELKTQILEKNELICRLRREVNVANNKVIKLEQMMCPAAFRVPSRQA